MDTLPRPLVVASSAAVFFAVSVVTMSTAQGASPSGAVERRVVAAAMPSHARELSACYGEVRERIAGFESRIVVTYTIGRGGDVGDVAVVSSSVPDAALEQCVSGIVASFEFPPAAEAVMVTAPVTFRPV